MKSFFAAILGVALSLLLLEGLCQGFYFFKNDSVYDSGRILGALGASPQATESRRGAALPQLYADQREVIHPYTGYVRDYNDAFRKHYGYDTNFAPVAARSPDTLVIALFGGSVAMHVHHALEAAFAKALAAAGDARKPALVNFALGGYKQPQQLMALDYFLALGAQYDVVVNLDGFNEVVLPYAENLPEAVSPFYPRIWNQRVSDNLDAGRLKALAGIVEARGHLEDIVADLSLPILSRSAAWGLWSSWRAARWQGRVIALNAALRAGDAKPFLETGPPFDNADPGKTMAALAAFWARSSRLMQAASQASGSAYFHFLQPNQYVAGAKPLSPEEKATAYTPDAPYAKAAVLGYPALSEAGRELAASGVPFFDATGVFAGRAETLYLDACCHVNEAGNAILAAFIADTVLTRLR